MIAFEILDIKQFMSKLLKDSMFNEFEVSSMEVITITKFTISGDLNKSFLSSDERELAGERKLVTWAEIQGSVFEIIKGNKPPSSLKIVFSLSKHKIHNLVEKLDLSITSNDVNGMYLNVLFENNVLKCTTGTSIGIFTMDKTLERYWDDSVKKFFNKHEIPIN